MRPPALLAPFLLGFVISGCAPGTEPFPASDIERFEAALAATSDAQGAPGTVMLVEDGAGHRWVGVSGLADVATDEPATERTLFLTASVAKTFTAAVVLALVDEGRLSLDQTLEEWVPRVPHADRITLRMLLDHTSGIASYNHTPGWEDAAAVDRTHRFTSDELVDLAVSVSADFPPGEGWSYSNTGYILLGMVVEAVVGRPLVEETRARFFAPLGMNDTVPVDEVGDGLWSSYIVGDDGAEPVVRLPGYPADGGYVSSLHDLGIWARHFLGGRLHRPETLAEAHVGAGAELLGAIASAYGFESGGYGAGMIVASDATLGALYAGGGNTDGARTFVAYLADQDLWFVVAVNSGEGRVPLVETISAAGPLFDALRTGTSE
jgi:D-alanyl-D-alanine carboxypeptidase